MSYISVFENFWNQIELYGKLKESGKSLAKSNKQLEEANEQLKLQSKVQKEFVNVAAHELRTPIVPILNLSELLYTRLKRRELQESDHLQQLERQRQLQLQLQQEQQMIQVIKRNAYRLHQLTEDILDVTKIESNSLKLKKELFDLNDTASNIINDLKVDISIRLLYETSQSSVNNKEEPFIVYADKGRITQVISNLLNNAVKFTKQGTITVKITKLDNIDHNLIISIKDSGSGIDPDILSRLFEKFVSKSDQGTGLGLYISKNIVEAHGGRIWAMNNSSDQRGCTFCFTLPLADLNQQRTRSSDDSGQ
jgi:signal transduction histidine kinase